ncbi:signal peptidase I [Sutcliffiella cohnii]|uniref:signal peptidase I n=1 Tax=Sutcliffiella cohnii TaxID=33932 RepID=UPI000836D410|nr:signal peptidase I [Sutcliffiella cohnii]MED4016804.1 signal peptidase I [Sutcliffiella cohnii]
MKNKNRFKITKWRVVFLSFFFLILLRICFFSNYVVEGHSMKPTLEEGNLLVVNTFVYHVQEPKRFDIVVFKQGENSDHYVKRVIGLPGEKIEYLNDVLYINDKAINENFIKEQKDNMIRNNLTGNFTLKDLTGEEVVPKGHLFVIGDNRLGSYDSRHFGFVKMDDIVGKVNMRYWPLGGIE